MRHLARFSRFDVVETNFLNWYFRDKKESLPFTVVCGADWAHDMTTLSALFCYTYDFSSCGKVRFKPWHIGPPPTSPADYCRSAPHQMYYSMIDLWRELIDIYRPGEYARLTDMCDQESIV
jgi:hypothetical protein